MFSPNYSSLNKLRAQCAYEQRIKSYDFIKHGDYELYKSWCDHQFVIDCLSKRAKDDEYNYEYWSQQYKFVSPKCKKN